MSYTALYRKFRPDIYDDVKGQGHITTTLKNQITSNRIGHAYLFSGTRGTGKTTIAKIFAKAVNCENPVDGNPCNECSICKSIQAGTSMNVIEMDAASNNSVDDVRQIVEEVQYRPTEGRYKVYIVDEVHMLTNAAFNALLKTLEEPPEYVMFILATTEAHKLPITILSRCQRYDFKHISVDTIQERLRELADIEKMNVEDRALRFIAKKADGSMRDALSLLDQCDAFCMGQELTYDRTLDILGAVDTDVFSNMLLDVVGGNCGGCIQKLEELVVFGKDLSQFVAEFTWYLRNLLLVRTADGAEEIIDMSSEKMERLKEEAQMLEPEVIMRYIRVLSELTNQIRYATQKRVLIEVALIKLAKPQMEMNLDSLKDRVAKIEKQLESGLVNVSVVKLMSGDSEAQQAAKEPEVPKKERAVPEEVREVANHWLDIVNQINGKLGVILKKRTRLSVDDNGTLCVVGSSQVDYGTVNSPENVTLLENIIEEMIDKHVDVEFRLAETEKDFEENYSVIAENKIHFQIEESDDEEDLY